ncbi:hypothetical protein KAJ89_03320 [Candidatus Parcubacteria bacterium]|nr:hypothetical protein [Candidatus Parcubacteria bacterium]
MAKEALQSNTFTKEARPMTGSLKSVSGFGRGAFGTARFGTSSGYEHDKEALQSNSKTKEALPSKIY